MEPGFYEIGDAEYFADPWLKNAVEGAPPALSASLAKAALSKSIQHAWLQCPACPSHKPFVPNAAMEFGKAVHALVFGGENIVEVKHPDYRTKAAQSQRALANMEGKIPILSKKLVDLRACAEIVKRRFDALYDGPYIAEQVALWKLDGKDGEPTGPRRAKIDSRHASAPIIVDLKSTKASIAFEDCEKRVYSDRLHIQAAAYVEALETLEPQWTGRVRFFFQFVEQDFPYALSRPVEIPTSGIDFGREQWAFAGHMWDEAVAEQNFTRFGGVPRFAQPPVWAMSQWEDTKAEYAHLQEEYAA